MNFRRTKVASVVLFTMLAIPAFTHAAGSADGELARPTRLLSRAEILNALVSSAMVSQFPGLQSLRIEDIAFAPDILVAEAAPKIEITSIGPDISGSATRVRAWIPAEPRLPPFWVTLRRTITAPSAKAGPAANPPAETLSVPPRSAAPATTVKTAATAAVTAAPENAAPSQMMLIQRGKVVQLLMRGKGMRITASGTALEPGREGQRIRVRSEYAGKIVLATVVDAETVELEY